MIEINGKVYRNIQEQVEQNKEDIAELKESGSTSYTAGDGIDITEGVISVDDTLTGNKTFKSDAINIEGSTGASLNLGTSTNKVALKSTGEDLTFTVPSLENFYIQNQAFPMGRIRFGLNYTKPAGTTYTFATLDDIPAAVSGTNDGTNWTSLTVGNDTYDIPSGGGSQLYQHNVVYKALNSNSKIVTYFTAQFVSASSIAISSKARLITYLDGAGFSSDTSSIDQAYLPVNGSTITTMNNSVPGRIYGIHYNTEEDEIYLISDYGDIGNDQFITVSYTTDNYSTVSVRDKVITL